MTHNYNLRERKASPKKVQTKAETEMQARVRRAVESYGPENAGRIIGRPSATGQGVHLHFARSLVTPEPPNNAHRSTAIDIATLPAEPNAGLRMLSEALSDGSSSSDETERPHTPQPRGPFSPGSVIRTPRKLQASPNRIGGHGIPIWGGASSSSVVEQTNVFIPAGHTARSALMDVGAGRQREEARRARDVPRIHAEQLERQRERDEQHARELERQRQMEEDEDMDSSEDEEEEDDDETRSQAHNRKKFAGFTPSPQISNEEVLKTTSRIGGIMSEEEISQLIGVGWEVTYIDEEQEVSQYKDVAPQWVQTTRGGQSGQQPAAGPSNQPVAGPSNQPVVGPSVLPRRSAMAQPRVEQQKQGVPKPAQVTKRVAVKALGPHGTEMWDPMTHQEYYIVKTEVIDLETLTEVDEDSEMAF